jgi:isopenicillin-N N-acyltransferase like protein
MSDAGALQLLLDAGKLRSRTERMAMGNRLLLHLVPWLLLSLGLHPAQACSLFGAIGNCVQGGGTIVAKNRDRCPLLSGLKVFVPETGYRYLGLVSLDSPEAPAVAGINEKGLVVVDASPSSLALQEEDYSAIPLTQALLARCASVEEVLAQKELFRASYPVFEMVGDRQQLALIEIAPGGQVAIQVCDEGTLYHTNHYLSSELLWANQRPHTSSRVRWRRLKRLLSWQRGPFDFADFLVCSQDRHAGPDNSINRLGSTPRKTRTLATFVVQLSDKAPHVFVRISNPGELDKIVNFRLEPTLWAKGRCAKIETKSTGKHTSEVFD